MLLLLVWACSKDGDDSNGGNGLVQNVTADPTDVGTVVRVTFDTKEEATATVKFGPEDLRYETPATEKGTHHEVLLVGLPALTTAHYQIVVGSETDEERTVETGTVDPTAFQPLTVTGDGNDLFAGVTMLGSSTRVALLDPEGRYVWTHIDERPGLFSYRMRLLRDGSGVVYNVANVSGEPTSEGTGLVKVPFDGSGETFVALDYMAHDFVELEDGTFAGIAFKEGPLPDKCKALYTKLGKKTLLGNHIVEVAPDGTQTEVWDSWDCFDPCVDVSDTLDDPVPEPGWTFTNALDYDEGTDSYLVSMRHLSSIASVSRATGECNWVFGNTPSATTKPVGEVFKHEHQFEYLRDQGQMLVFDNDGAGFVSRVLEYAFDPKLPEADLIWSYDDSDVFSPVLGDVQRADNGDTMVVWSLAGRLERVTTDGDSVWSAITNAGTVFGFGEHYTSPYEPTSAPD